MEVLAQSMVPVIHVHVPQAFRGQTAKKHLVQQHLVLMAVHVQFLDLVSSVRVLQDTRVSHVKSLHALALRV